MRTFITYQTLVELCTNKLCGHQNEKCENSILSIVLYLTYLIYNQYHNMKCQLFSCHIWLFVHHFITLLCGQQCWPTLYQFSFLKCIHFNFHQLFLIGYRLFWMYHRHKSNRYDRLFIQCTIILFCNYLQLLPVISNGYY